MNAEEIALLVCAVAACAALFALRGPLRTKWALSLLLAPVLWLVIAGSTQFLTVDEKAMVGEPVSLSTSTLKQWSNGAFRTTDITVGPAMHLLQSAVALSAERSARIAKALHWFFGFCMLVVLVMLLKPFWAGTDGPFYAIVILGSATLLPTSAIAFNMCNYDLYSMAFAMLSLALIAAGFSRRAPRLLVAAVIVGALAAQEKLIATPVLWFAMVMYVAERQLRLDVTAGAKVRFMTACKSTFVSVACAAAVVAVSYAILIAIRSGALPADYYGSHPFKIILPVINPLVLLLRGMGGAGMLAAVEEAAREAPPIVLWTMIAMGIVVTVALFVLIMTAVTGPVGRPAWAAGVRAAGRYMPVINYALLVATAVIGIASTYGIQGYWAPAHPVSPGHYVPTISFNGAVLHFGAQTAAGHELRLFGWAYAVFYNAMPTVLLVLMVAAGPWRWFKKNPLPPALEFIVSICLTAPAFYALGHVPLQNRYFNLFMLLLLCATLLRYVPLARLVSPLYRYGLGFMVVALLAAELLPFRPAFGMFRPVWSDFGARQTREPAAGAINPVGLGGGEELMLAGEKIKRSGAMAQPGGIRLYHNHYGAWLGDNRGIAILDMADHTVPLTYTGRDYYIVDRLSVVQGWLAFPSKIAPEFTIHTRGFAQAWVYRGDELAKQGFSFR